MKHRTAGYANRSNISKHKIWSKIKNFVVIQEVHKDGVVKPRIRIELRRLPVDTELSALAFATECIACKNIVHPFRKRQGGGVYYAPSCALSVSVGCSRGSAASNEYEAIRREFNKPSLFQFVK